MTKGKNWYFLGKLMEKEEQGRPLGSCRGWERRRMRWCSERPLWGCCIETLWICLEILSTDINALPSCTPTATASVLCFCCDEDTFQRWSTSMSLGMSLWYIWRTVHNYTSLWWIQGRTWADQAGGVPLMTCWHRMNVLDQTNPLPWDWAVPCPSLFAWEQPGFPG